MIYPQNCPNQTCGYWLITPNQQTLCIETSIFYKSANGELQTNSVDGEMLITINLVIVAVIEIYKVKSKGCKYLHSIVTFSNL